MRVCPVLWEENINGDSFIRIVYSGHCSSVDIMIITRRSDL